jgi:hypothetical protein
MALAYSLNVTELQLSALLGALESQFGWAILENVLDMQFCRVGQELPALRFDQTFTLPLYDRGRAFGEQLEVRWRRKEPGYVVLVVAEARLDPLQKIVEDLGALPEPILLENCGSLQVVLWGEYYNFQNEGESDNSQNRDRYWYEARVPKLLSYPWEAPDRRLILEVARYHEAREQGTSHPTDFIYRFVRLTKIPEEWQKKPEATSVPLDEGMQDDQSI